MSKKEKKPDINKQIIDLILAKKKGITAKTAGEAYKSIKAALRAMEYEDDV